jgi:deoxyribodipyrimidine photolyase-related protein
LDDPDNPGDLDSLILNVVTESGASRFEYQLPDEFRLDQQLRDLCSTLSIGTSFSDTEHFLTFRDEWAHFFKGKKQYLMESFYRHMRKKGGWLMDEHGDPLGGQWNYDRENRKKIPQDRVVPTPKIWSRDVSELADLIHRNGIRSIGSIDARAYIWPVTREEQLELLDYFCTFLLPSFGDFQDALHPEHWSLFHSRLSFGMNIKLLSPKEVVERAIAEWKNRPDEISLSQIEGFVRQIIGWREYMRGVYWARMPGDSKLNFFSHDRDLPEWFWTGDTRMACLRHAISQSLEYAYAHHIQRLMVTGNFALLAGISPDQLDIWYLGIYIDAIEWVEITNTRGMSQFADGGIVATKPYVSSANYLKKMGHYCEGCFYDPSVRTGNRACPFNSLYWHFFQRHRDLLANNPRIGMVYRTLDKMDPTVREQLFLQAENYLQDLDSL